MTNPSAEYELKGCKIKERQLFVRTYYVQRELHTGTYFIDDGRAFFICSDDGAVGRCNFNARFLNTGHTKSIQPLNAFYEGTVGDDVNAVYNAPVVTDTDAPRDCLACSHSHSEPAESSGAPDRLFCLVRQEYVKDGGGCEDYN